MPTPMPGLTIATATGGTSRPGASNPAGGSTSTSNPHDDGAASPTRPPVSPITPTRTGAAAAAAAHLAPTVTGSGTHYIANFAAERPNLIGDGAGAGSDANATARPLPRPEPLDFDANPDVLALQSTIAILQIQRRKALADMGALKVAQDAALADPTAFVADLGAGRVRSEADPLFGGRGCDDDGSSDSGSNSSGEGGAAAAAGSKKPPWSNLPQPQNVVRMPPVNFDKYGVVGDVLDKLHHEQLTRPPQGAPAVIAADGTYKLKGAASAAPAPDGKPYIGVAAPYNPLKDKLDKKPKGGKR